MQTLDLTKFFPYQLSILQSHISDHVGAFYRETYGMSRNEWRILAVLAMYETPKYEIPSEDANSPDSMTTGTKGLNKKVSAKDICAFTQLAKMPVSRALQQLVKANLIERQQSTTDMRLVHFSLTRKGIERYQAILPKIRLAEQQILQLLNEQEQKQLTTLTSSLLTKIQAQLMT